MGEYRFTQMASIKIGRTTNGGASPVHASGSSPCFQKPGIELERFGGADSQFPKA